MKIHLCGPGEYQPLENELSAKSKAANLTAEEFEKEFWSVAQGLEAALKPNWSSGIYGEYMIADEYWSKFSRVLPMAICGPRMFCSDYLATVQTFLKSTENEWVVHVAAEPEDFPGHELDWALLFITRDTVYIDFDESKDSSTNPYPALFNLSLVERERDLA